MKQKTGADDLSEELRILSELSPALMGVTDGEGRYRWINLAWADKLGYAIEDVSTIPYTALIHPDDRSKAVPSRDGKDPGTVELRHSRKDGSYVWLEWSIHASEERGEIYTVAYDVTARRELESTLDMMEQKYSDLVENADDVICTGDLEGKFISMNKAAERISGYSSAEILGVPFSHFVAPEYRTLLKQMTALKLSGRESTVYEIELLTKDGRRIPMELNTRLMYANGKPVGVQGIARDIRIRKKLADQLKQRNKDLEKANATIRSLMNQDSLTKLPNRRSLKNTLEKSISFSKRTKQPLSLVLCDLDHFKDINDNFGHAAGDQVLSAFGGLLGPRAGRKTLPPGTAVKNSCCSCPIRTWNQPWRYLNASGHERSHYAYPPAPTSRRVSGSHSSSPKMGPTACFPAPTRRCIWPKKAGGIVCHRARFQLRVETFARNLRLQRVSPITISSHREFQETLDRVESHLTGRAGKIGIHSMITPPQLQMEVRYSGTRQLPCQPTALQRRHQHVLPAVDQKSGRRIRPHEAYRRCLVEGARRFLEAPPDQFGYSCIAIHDPLG